MSSPQPAASSPLALRWRMFGISFCITPSFWLMSTFMGFIMMQYNPTRIGFWQSILLWVFCTLLSVLVHEMGHVLMGRLFGQPGNITLAGLGGQAAGKYEYLRPWERICVAAAGPGAGFLFLGLQVLVDVTQWNMVAGWLDWDLELHWSLLRWWNLSWRSNLYFQTAMLFLLIMNLLWNLINLLPIIPMDGGMILREVCTIIAPQGGVKFAVGLSFLLASTVVIYCLLKIATQREWLRVEALNSLPSIVDPYFGLIMFGLLAWQNFSMLRQINLAERSAHFQRPDDD